MTDYREESTFSFDPGKLPLVLLKKGHHQNKSCTMKARKHRAQCGRNQSQSDHVNDFHPDHQGPLWALAQSEILKLRSKKSAEAAQAESHSKSRTESNPTGSGDDLPEGAVCRRPVPNDYQEVSEMGFTLQITESRSQCGCTDNKVPIPLVHHISHLKTPHS